MNTPATSHRPTLAVLGWTPEAAQALHAFNAARTYEAVSILDASGTALVRARQDTGLPCFQQVRQYLASADVDALLVGVPSDPGVLTRAAARGMDLVLLSGVGDAATLEAAAEATHTHGRRLALLRPDAHDAGVDDLARLLEAPEWRPRYVDVTLEAATDVERLMGSAVLHALRLAGDLHGDVRATAWGDSEARVLHAEVDAREVHAALRVRHAPEFYLRIAGDAPAGAFDLRVSLGAATLAYHSTPGERVSYEPASLDQWRIEAYRVMDADDTALTRDAAGLLSAVSRAALTGETQSTDCCNRPELHLLEGGGVQDVAQGQDVARGQGVAQGDDPLHSRRGNLRLVVS